MTKEEKLAAIDKILPIYRREAEEAKALEEEWSRDMTFRLRMMELLKTNSDRAAQDVAWMDSIRAEVEAGKL